MEPAWDLLIRNVRIATCANDAASVLAPGFLAVHAGRIAQLGTLGALPEEWRQRNTSMARAACSPLASSTATRNWSTPGTVRASSSSACRASLTAELTTTSMRSLATSVPPPVGLFRRHGVPMAVATDCNPGTSPTTHLPLMMNMACTLFRLMPAEALLSVTRHAARALGLQGTHGTIQPGRHADLCLWDAQHPAELASAIGASPLHRCLHDGIEQPA